MRRRSWLVVFAVVVVIFIVAAWLVARLLQPERLTPMLLAAIAEASGLEINVSAPADYALRPEPRLRLRGVLVMAPGSPQPLLEIGLLDIALPWQTLFGGEPVITAVAIDNARLHVAALQTWLQQRETGAPGTWPTLKNGLEISNSSIIGDDWQLQIDALAVPRFALGQPATLTMSGHVLRNAADNSSDWPLRLRVDTVIARDDTAVTLDPFQLGIDAASPLATSGNLHVGDMMQFNLAGEMTQWPAQWPALPGTDPSLPVTFALAGNGSELSRIALTVRLVQAQTRLALKLVPQQLQTWLDSTAASPLPPLSGELHTTRMMIDGAELEGVDIQVEADAEP